MPSRDPDLRDPCPPTTSPSRRRLLLGLGALAVAPAATALATGAPATAAAAAEPECLADLIEMGVVTRGDLVAG